MRILRREILTPPSEGIEDGYSGDVFKVRLDVREIGPDDRGRGFLVERAPHTQLTGFASLPLGCLELCWG